ncbi:MAG: type II toxin-antitoxin system Phd/YefM family antitoxin [Candidatus Dormibacteraeota bacterium]|uniref:Antitoxin n=1 Tax=Candidatus Dormiibacter inghamiae TaxID=3127013 RepID=A0A934K9V9_9BACT|nr:type II toxin-antitoxin system Phd/YefM family antitoxin [Candidatus Dormibacteraeota bacterium]MBJ7607645.1 type II toxin-antitoxin system Phd/YefM family antitoxin [Candidatus Dormibacteraeota bacterium]
MEQVGVRALRQNASRLLARVKAGESLEITERGRPVARLVPTPRDILAELYEAGHLGRGHGSLSDLPPPQDYGASLSDILQDLRREER